MALHVHTTRPARKGQPRGRLLASARAHRAGCRFRSLTSTGTCPSSCPRSHSRFYGQRLRQLGVRLGPVLGQDVLLRHSDRRDILDLAA